MDLRDQAAQGTQVPREVSKTSLIMLADLSQMKRTPGDLQNIYRKQKGANTMKVPPFSKEHSRSNYLSWLSVRKQVRIITISQMGKPRCRGLERRQTKDAGFPALRAF